MNKNIILTLMAALVLVCACSKNEFADPTAGHKLVPVNVALDIDGVKGDLTKSATALFPEIENWIFDYYYVQFNSNDISLTSGHRRADVTVGDLTVQDQVWLWDVGESTVTFVANILPADAPYTDNPGWEDPNTGIILIADNLVTYKTIKFDMAQRVAAAEDHTLHHMPMCGYWQGSITASNNSESDPFHMTATLGRMITKMNVTVVNNSGAAVTNVTVNNASKAAYIFPQIVNEPLGASDYTSISSNVNIANGSTETIFFYTAPNYAASEANATSLTFTAGGKTATVPVGDNVAEADYNLYMNTIYTLNITLK